MGALREANLMDELARRLEQVKALQTRETKQVSPSRTKRQRQFDAIDRKHMKRKVLYFPQESRYAFPANIGNARNPLVFGKIPVEYQIVELIENEQVMVRAGLRPSSWPRVHGHLKTCPCVNCKKIKQ